MSGEKLFSTSGQFHSIVAYDKEQAAALTERSFSTPEPRLIPDHPHPLVLSVSLWDHQLTQAQRDFDKTLDDAKPGEGKVMLGLAPEFGNPKVHLELGSLARAVKAWATNTAEPQRISYLNARATSDSTFAAEVLTRVAFEELQQEFPVLAYESPTQGIWSAYFVPSFSMLARLNKTVISKDEKGEPVKMLSDADYRTLYAIFELHGVKHTAVEGVSRRQLTERGRE